MRNRRTKTCSGYGTSPSRCPNPSRYRFVVAIRNSHHGEAIISPTNSAALYKNIAKQILV